MILDYEKGGNRGQIMKNSGRFLAVTAVKSRWFKTLRGAEEFMKEEGYKLEQENDKIETWVGINTFTDEEVLNLYMRKAKSREQLLSDPASNDASECLTRAYYKYSRQLKYLREEILKRMQSQQDAELSEELNANLKKLGDYHDKLYKHNKIYEQEYLKLCGLLDRISGALS